MDIEKKQSFLQRHFVLVPVVTIYAILFLLDSAWRLFVHRL